MKLRLLFMFLVFAKIAFVQNVGIGTTAPQTKLHIKSDYEILRLQGQSSYLSFYDNSGSYIGYLWNRDNTSIDIGTAGSLPVTISPNVNTVATFHPNGNLGLGVSNPEFRLDVLGRMRLRHQGEISGIYFNNGTNTASPGFIGMMSNNEIGLYGSVSGWTLTMNTNTGNTGFGVAPDNNARLYTVGSSTALYTKGLFTNSNALKIGTGRLVVENAGVATSTSVFVHKATTLNTPVSEGYTVIDHPHCNNNPTAILTVTLNGTYGAGTGAGYNTPPEQTGSPPGQQIISTTSFMIFYNGPSSSFYASAPTYARDRWLIRTYSGGYVSYALNFNFNVMVINPN